MKGNTMDEYLKGAIRCRLESVETVLEAEKKHRDKYERYSRLYYVFDNNVSYFEGKAKALRDMLELLG